MSKPDKAPDKKFTRRTETSTICMSCFATVRSRTSEDLVLEEDLHLALCPGPPNHPHPPDCH